jgi:predicted DNA-binding transcriptional regulator AlpA
MDLPYFSPDLPRFVDIDELAARLRRSKWTIYQQARNEPDQLPRVTRIAGRVLWLESDVQAFLASPPPPRPSMRGKWPRPQKAKVAKGKPGRPTKAAQVAAREAALYDAQRGAQ